MDNFIIFLAKYLVFIIVLVAVFYWLSLSGKTKFQVALAVFLAAIAAVILVKIFGNLYYHPRPFISQSIVPLVPHGNDNGFPSEHTTYSMTITAVLYFYHRRLAAGLFILTLLVGLGRVLAHVHAPIDILAGLLAGALAGAGGYYLAKNLRSVKTAD